VRAVREREIRLVNIREAQYVVLLSTGFGLSLRMYTLESSEAYESTSVCDRMSLIWQGRTEEGMQGSDREVRAGNDLNLTG
jgi:hypothetical protein